ncbi:MAG TPA: ATP-binding protein [Chroococcales cyanobacterium]
MSEKKSAGSLWKYAAWALGLANLSWLLWQQVQNVDRQLFDQAATALGASAAHIAAAQAAPQVDAVLVLVLVSASLAIGYLLSSLPRTVAWLQVIALAALAQWLFWSLFHLRTRPLEWLAGVVLGAGAGVFLRRQRAREHQAAAAHLELSLRNQELQTARLQMVKQDEVDRRLLAADLHDQVLNDLKSMRMKIHEFEQKPDPELAATIDNLIDKAMKEVREVMDSLHPSTLEHLGFVAALEDCLRHGAERGGFKVRFKGELDENDVEKLSHIEQSLLYRLVQESVNNICKHAGAGIVRGAVSSKDGDLIITIQDDGKGMAPDPESQALDGSRGLRYMRQRADLIGATIAWRSPDSEPGTIVEIRLKLSAKAD